MVALVQSPSVIHPRTESQAAFTDLVGQEEANLMSPKNISVSTEPCKAFWSSLKAAFHVAVLISSPSNIVCSDKPLFLFNFQDHTL